MTRLIIMLSIFTLSACDMSKQNLNDASTIMYYSGKRRAVSSLESGKILTDEYVEQLKEEVALFNKTKKSNASISTAYSAGQYQQAKTIWISYIQEMNLRNPEKIELIDYYEKKVLNIRIEYK